MSDVGTSAWTNTDEPAPLGTDRVVLVDGQVFCVSASTGDVHAGAPQGLFVADSRVLSRIELTLDAHPLEPLTAVHLGGGAGRIVLRPAPAADVEHNQMMLVRTRRIGMGLQEDIEIRNYADHSVSVTLALALDADFASLFAVKERRVEHTGERSVLVNDQELSFRWRHGELERSVRLSFVGEGAQVSPSGVSWRLDVPGQGRVSVCWQADVGTEDEWLPSRVGCGQRAETPTATVDTWQQSVPRISTDHGPMRAALQRAIVDLGSLRLFDPAAKRLPVVAAGAPWFMTLFGRDAILTAWMALLVDPTLALGVLDALAELQGDAEDDNTEEQPGRILHELRFDKTRDITMLGGQAYYGSVDATPLFVMLLAELADWGAAAGDVRRLLPHADRAMAWIEQYGDSDGDGYVEYLRLTPHGLANQGWKDSWDGIRYKTGEVAEPPIALCEVQGYVYAAYLARAKLADRSGDEARARDLRAKAAALKARFNDDFWMDEYGWYAVGLDADKQPISSLTSNPGHCLWTGIVDEEHAPMVVHRLMSSELWTGWGIRTLSSANRGYNPLSYHCGSVWPHDSAICAAGMRRYGFVRDANRVMLALLDAASFNRGRLPELLGGLDRRDVSEPVPYPTSCSPQAWSAASPLLFARTMLGLDPCVPEGTVRLEPALPRPMTRLRIAGLPLGATRVDIEVGRDGVHCDGLPRGVRLIRR
jgi:glycogen debranching enzyme